MPYEVKNDVGVYIDNGGAKRDALGVVILAGGGGGTGGGGAATIADGADVAEGATMDAAYVSSTGAASGTVVGLLKGLFARNYALGLQADGAAASDTGAASLIALFKRSLGYLSTLAGVANKPTAGTQFSLTVTTTSGAANLPADPSRKPGDVQGQNVSGVEIGFNEFNGTAVLGAATTYRVPPGSTFSITTNQQVNFIAASGTANVAVTRNY